MQASIRDSEWSVVDVAYSHGPSPVQVVFRRAPRSTQWIAWVIVAESAFLRRIGASGRGLYTARGFSRDAIVGKYSGRVVGHFPSRHAAITAPQTRRLLMRDHDKIVTLRAPHGGFNLVDGKNGGAPFIQLINDGRDTRRPNAELTEGGYLRVTNARIKPFNLDKTLAQNSQSEFLIDYGEEYWSLRDQIGTSTEHAIEMD